MSSERTVVAELYALDVPKLVRAVERVLDGMRNDDLAVRGGGEGVLAPRALELGDIDVGHCISGSDNFTDDAQLARVDKFR